MKTKQNFEKFQKMMAAASMILTSTTALNAVASSPVFASTINIASQPDNLQDGKTYVVYQLFTTNDPVTGNAGNRTDGISYYVKNDATLKALQDAIKDTAEKMGKTVTDTDINSQAKVVEWISQNVMGDKVEEDHYGNKSDDDKGINYQSDEYGKAYRSFLESLQKVGIPDSAKVSKEDLGTNVDGEVEGSGKTTTITVPDNGYYVIAEKTHSGNQNQATSLIMAAQVDKDDDLTINLKSDHPDVVKKVFEDSHKAYTDSEGKSVEANNDSGYNDIADYEIGEQVPYEFISKVPNMNSYQTYKFEFNDDMDNELTLNEDSFKVTIGGKEYAVAKEGSEEAATAPFILSEDATKNTDTSKHWDLKCSDLITATAKDGTSHPAENNEIKVTYTARLNENAAKSISEVKTGQKGGFENTVKITYSNNPQSTGYGTSQSEDTGESEEDTVVVYTFGENFDKINDDTNKKGLEHAKFKLFRGDQSDKATKDASLTDKVLFKQNTDGSYVVVHDAKEGDSGIVDFLESDENGNFRIYGLDADDTYTLQETEAPTGYTQLYGNFTFTLKADYQADRAYMKQGNTDKDAAEEDEVNKELEQLNNGNSTSHDPGYTVGTNTTALTGLTGTLAYNKDNVNDRVDQNEDETVTQDKGDNANTGVIGGNEVSKDGTSGKIAENKIVNKKNAPLAFTGGQAGIMLAVMVAGTGLYVIARKKQKEAEELD